MLRGDREGEVGYTLKGAHVHHKGVNMYSTPQGVFQENPFTEGDVSELSTGVAEHPKIFDGKVGVLINTPFLTVYTLISTCMHALPAGNKMRRYSKQEAYAQDSY